MQTIPLRSTRKKSMTFMLMPLVDVIFLLLTFFMLSSNLAPYSTFKLDRYRQDDGGGVAANAAGPDIILTVSAGEVRANGAVTMLADFPGEAARLREEGARSVVVFVRPSATTQDIVSVLEALQRAAFASVTVRTHQAAG